MPTPAERPTEPAERLAQSGQLRAAAAAYRAAIYQSAGGPAAPGAAHLGLGDILYEWNDLAGAGAHWHSARDAAEAQEARELLAAALLRLARLAQAGGRPEAAAAMAREAERVVGPMAPTGYLAALRTGLALDRGAAEAKAAAMDWLATQAGYRAGDEVCSLEGQTVALVHGRALLAARGAAVAEGYLNQLIARFDEGAPCQALIAGYALLAIARQLRGDAAGGLLALVQALMLGELQGYARTFLDLGPALGVLLAQVRGDWQPYAARLLQQAQAGPGAAVLPGGRPAAPTTLTSRELEVLRLAGAGHGNSEIAAALGLGLGTVKQHLARAYRKLGVRRRAEAAERARALGWLE
jgi:LuxR family maltose regulon positive regulatory protein